MSAIRGYPSQQKLERTDIQFVTVEPVRKEQNGLSVTAHQFVYEVGTDAAEAGSTASKIVATAHAALEGDVIRLTSGAQSGKEIKVFSVSANEINFVEDLPAAVASGVTFQILRHKYPTVDATGFVNVNASIVEAAVAADGGALPALVKVAGGYDGSSVQVLKTDASGELQVDVLSSALPNGAATETTLADIKTAVQLIDDAISGSEMQVDVVSSALPSGAATSAKQDSEIALLQTIDADTGSIATSVSTIAGAVSGSEMQVDVISSALPSGAATSAAQTDGSQKTQIVDGAGEVVEVKALNSTLLGTDKGLITHSVIQGQTTGGGGGYVDVKVTPSGALVTDATITGLDAAILGQEAMATSLPVVLASDQSAIPVTDNGGSLTVDGSVSATQSGTWNITNITGSVSLPTGAATETTLSSISSRIPASLGQDTMSDSLAVVIASDQSAIPASQSGTWNITNVSGTVSLPTGAATETTLADIKTSVQLLDNAISGNEMQVDIVASLPAGTNTIGKVDVNTLSVIDLLDAGILDTSSTNIAGSASSPTQVVASTAAATKKLQLLDTTGAFIGVYTGAALSEVLQFVMGPGSDQTIEHVISAGTRVSLKRLDSTTAVSSGIVAINFIGG